MAGLLIIVASLQVLRILQHEVVLLPEAVYNLVQPAWFPRFISGGTVIAVRALRDNIRSLEVDWRTEWCEGLVSQIFCN